MKGKRKVITMTRAMRAACIAHAKKHGTPAPVAELHAKLRKK